MRVYCCSITFKHLTKKSLKYSLSSDSLVGLVINAWVGWDVISWAPHHRSADSAHRRNKPFTVIANRFGNFSNNCTVGKLCPNRTISLLSPYQRCNRLSMHWAWLDVFIHAFTMSLTEQKSLMSFSFRCLMTASARTIASCEPRQKRHSSQMWRRKSSPSVSSEMDGAYSVVRQPWKCRSARNLGMNHSFRMRSWLVHQNLTIDNNQRLSCDVAAHQKPENKSLE